MKQNVSEGMFIDSFKQNEERKNNFSYDGLRALYDYLEQYENDIGEELEFDLIALCCEYSEYKDLKEFLNDYPSDIDKKDYDDLDDYKQAIEEEINDNTQLIKLDDDLDEGFIIQAY
jgi:uncharacterized alpha/beta hydrolase family protein